MTPEELLRAVRRRLRILRAASALVGWAWLAAAVAVVVVLLARVVPWQLLEPAGLLLPVAALLTYALWSATRRMPDLVVARVADHELGSRDALSAYLEFSATSNSHFTDRIRRRAAEVARSADHRNAAPWRRPPAWKVVVVVGGAAAALVLAGMANPQDTARERERAANQAVDEAIEQLRDAAAERGAESETGRRLLELATELETSTPLDALAALSRTEAELTRHAGADLQSAMAAVAGLDAAVQARPLPGGNAEQHAADQLEATAEQLDAMDPDQRQELADRLEDLAATQTVGSPEVATALHDAAAAVASADAGAASALRAAADAQRAQSADMTARAAAARAAGQVADVRSQLSAALSGQPRESPGKGQGQGEGKGEGDGKGQGTGQGKGQGQGAGGQPSGTVGAGQRGGSGQGEGGKGRLGQGQGGSTPSPEEEAGSSSVFAPEPKGSRGTDGPMQGNGGDLGQRQGTGDTSTQRGASRLPVSDAVRRYRDQASRAAARPGLPQAQRDLISSYFDRLSRVAGA